MLPENRAANSTFSSAFVSNLARVTVMTDIKGALLHLTALESFEFEVMVIRLRESELIASANMSEQKFI